MKMASLRYTGRNPLNGSGGFSLVELLVVMGIFIIVIMISSDAFNRIASSASQQIKSSDSNVQGIVGLEIMRSDLEHAGYGLPWELPFVADFEESQVGVNILAKGIDPASFNDKYNASGDINKVPRAIQSATAAAGAGVGAWEAGRDYLVIKSAFVGMNDAAKKWSYLDGVGAASTIKLWGTSEDFVANDRVITLDSRTRRLIGADMTHFSYPVPAALPLTPPVAYQTTQESDVYLVYGIKTAASNATTADPRAPYNRVDYYIKRPSAVKDMPARCAPGTGILYKSGMVHSGGGVDYNPLLECVADMQVIYSLDTNEDGGVDLHGNEDILTGMTSEAIRKQLKEIRVYILTHEGQKDSAFIYPSSTVQVGEFGLGRTYDLTLLSGIGDTWKNYRWKTYVLVVVPKNISN